MELSPKILIKEPKEVIRNLIFFLLFYLVLWLHIDLRLIYHGGGIIRNFPVFYKGFFFFKEFLPYPGGLLEYGSAFLSQFLYYAWAGAIIITCQAWLNSLFIQSYIKAINASYIKWLRFIPAILFLILYSQYTFYFTLTMALTVTLGFVGAYSKLIDKKPLIRLIAFLILSIVLYGLVGGAFIIFALLCGMLEILSKHRWQTNLLYMGSIFLIPMIEGVFIYGTSWVDAFSRLTPLFWKVNLYKPESIEFVYGYYGFLPIIIIGLIILRIIIKNPIPQKIIELFYIKNKNTRWIVNTCFLFLVTSIILFIFHDSKQKTVFAVDYYGYHRMWPEVLEKAKSHPNHDLVIATVNRALFHTGQLGNIENTLKQNPGTLLLNGRKHGYLHWHKSEIFLDLGYINQSEHNLVEALEYYGERPQILKRLVIINMIKNNIGTARIYLGALNKMLFHSNWANAYLDRIESDPTLSMDKQIQQTRRFIMDRDYTSQFPTTDALLLELLNRNRYNRMAFEYLMTYYLLTRNLKNFYDHLDRFKDFDYSHIPQLFEEAILLIASNPELKDKVLKKRLRIRRDSYLRFKKFIEEYGSYKGNKNAAFMKFSKEYRNSTFFYYTFYDMIINR